MPSLDAYFRGKHVLLTGGSTGIGLATACQLARLGAPVTLIARRASVLDEAKAKVLAGTPGATVHTLPLDVANEKDVMQKVGAHIQNVPADMLINNAGIVMPGRFVDLEYRHFREIMDVNYFGAVNMCRAVMPQLMERKGGHVANVGSLLSVMGVFGYSAYAASKFALYGLSEVIRAELWPYNVRTSILLPPDTDTPQHAFELPHLPPETRAIAGTVKMLTPEFVADTLLKGMAAGTFEIIPGFDSKGTVLAQRLVPGVVRMVCDNAQKKASAARKD
jgi:3-dehydrosphinganine reductase